MPYYVTVYDVGFGNRFSIHTLISTRCNCHIFGTIPIGYEWFEVLCGGIGLGWSGSFCTSEGAFVSGQGEHTFFFVTVCCFLRHADLLWQSFGTNQRICLLLYIPLYCGSMRWVGLLVDGWLGR